MLRSYGSSILQTWRLAAPLVVAALAAHLVTVVTTEFMEPVPLATALVATLIFAGVLATYAMPKERRIERDSEAAPSSWRRLTAAALAGLCIWTGVRLTSLTLGSASAFYCQAAVPWRIEIALFGSSVAGYLSATAAKRRRAWLVYPLTMVAFLWIAPFYGFFSAPVFLGIGLNVQCPGHSFATTVLVALGMIAGDQFGAVLANRFSAR